MGGVGGGAVLDRIKSKGLVLMSYIKSQCPYEKAGRGSGGLFVLPCSVRTQVAICEAQTKPLKNPEWAGTFIFTAGLLSLWHWDFCCCKLYSLRVFPHLPSVRPVPSPHSLSPPFLLSFLCIGCHVSTKVFS